MSEPEPAPQRVSPFDKPPQPLAYAEPQKEVTLADAVMSTMSNLILELENAARYDAAIGMVLAKKIELCNTTFEGIKAGVIRDDNTKQSAAALKRSHLYAVAKKHIAGCVSTYSREAERTKKTLQEFKEVIEAMKELPVKPLDALPVDADVQRMIDETKKRRKMLRALAPSKVRRAK